MKKHRPPKKTPAEAPADLPRAETVRRIMRSVLAGLVPVLFVGFFLTNALGEMPAGARMIALVQRVVMLALGVVVVGVSGLFGMRLLRLLRVVPERLLARFVLGAGLGLGTISLVTLGLGSAGLIGTGPSALLLGAMFLIGIPELRTVGDYLRRQDRPAAASLSPFELVLVFVCLIALLFELTLAFNLPVDYDACEYHLAAPARWFQLGRIGFITGNVFSNLPMNCEMLYLWSMGLCRHPMLGMHLAVVLNALTAVLAGGAVYVLARRFFSRVAALAALALFATIPWVLILTAINIYNEMLLTFYVTLAVYAFLEAAQGRRASWFVVSAIFAGLASGVKYTALAFFPLCVGVLPALFIFRSRRKALGLVYVLVVLAVVSPWLVKNVALTGNPTYPFFHNYFGGRDWSAEQAVKWISAQHIAAGTDRSGNIFVALWERVVAHGHGSLAVAGFLLLGLLAVRDPPVRWLVILLVLWTLLWYFFTHRVDRFWFPFAGVAAALAGRGFDLFRNRRVRLALAAVLVGALGFYLRADWHYWLQNVVGSYDIETGNDRFLAERHGIYRAILFARTLKSTDRLMMVGEAEGLYFPSNVSLSTVFDREVFTTTVGDLDDAEGVRRRLHEAGVTHIFVNWFEVSRLRETYTHRGVDGETVPGLPAFHPRDFKRLVEAGVLREIVEWRFGKPLEASRWPTKEILSALVDGKVCRFYEVK